MDEIDKTVDLCHSVLSRFSHSTREDHQHLCAVMGAMSQELREQNLPLTAIAYFGATCSSLDRLSTESDPPSHVVEALLTILSMILPKISVTILNKKREFLAGLVVRFLQSKSTSAGAVIFGLKCISHFIIIGDKASWLDISPLYCVLLSFITDSNTKARKQSHVCVRDVLLSFQSTSMLASASEGLTNIFERFLLLAGGSNADASEKSKGAQEVLYILDALKDCLPLMSKKLTTSIMKYFKTLLELSQTLVTKRITDCLSVFCLHPTSEVSSEALLDLLGSLALSVSTNETSADGLTITARLLDVGMKKVHSINRELCWVKLPVAFNALREILASEHEEAIFASTEALKNLIHACVDEDLINQGVMMDENVSTRSSGPTIIEKVCATIGSLVDYRYIVVWDMAFQIVSAMFGKLGKGSSYLLQGTVKSLADMQKLPDEDFPYRKQLHECVGSALAAMGPETFLGILPLNLEAEDPSMVNVWLFPILKQYTVGAHLSFFIESILGMARLLRQKSQALEVQGRIALSRSMDALVYSLWSLLPSFCNYPLDTAKSFKTLEIILCSTLRGECEIRGIICSSLKILIHQNRQILDQGKDLSAQTELSVSQQRAMALYSPQVAADNLNALRSSSKNLLTVLSEVFLKSSKDDGGCLQSTIGEVAVISDKKVVSKLFINKMRKLLEVTQEAVQEKSRSFNSMQIDNSSVDGSPSLVRSRLFDLAASLLPGLGDKEIGVLFSAVEPALQADEGLIQKKAYKVLSIMLRDCDSFLSEKLHHLLNVMIEVLPLCHFSAKRHRLDCLYFLMVQVIKDESEQYKHDIVCSFLTEMILALKEANKKTRNRAYDMLVQIGHACGDEENGGKKEKLHLFFNTIAGGLAGDTPHMISASVKGLARLSYEFSDLVSAAYSVLPSTYILLQRKNREIIKANLGLLKVLVAKSPVEGLQTHLRNMVEGLLKWQDNTKNHFKAKTKLLLEMLVKKCGLDAVKAVLPEEHMRLLTNIRKIKERKERKLAANSEETRSHRSKATTSRISTWNHTKIFSDFGDEETENSNEEYMDATVASGRRTKSSTLLNAKASSIRSKRTRGATKSLPEDFFEQTEEEPLDLLDRQKTRAALRSSDIKRKKAESTEEEPEVDSEGRLIIREGPPKKERRPSDPDPDSRSQLSMNSLSSRKSKKRLKTSESGWAYTGFEYASKKAGGDVKRKDKLEPYAYWPLDRKLMSRRPEHRAAARKGMASVVKLAKKLEGKSSSTALSMKSLKVNRNQRSDRKKSR